MVSAVDHVVGANLSLISLRVLVEDRHVDFNVIAAPAARHVADAECVVWTTGEELSYMSGIANLLSPATLFTRGTLGGGPQRPVSLPIQETLLTTRPRTI